MLLNNEDLDTLSTVSRSSTNEILHVVDLLVGVLLARGVSAAELRSTLETSMARANRYTLRAGKPLAHEQ